MDTDELSDFFLSKLATISPCSSAFDLLRAVTGFVAAHFVDLTEAGEVRPASGCTGALPRFPNPSSLNSRSS